MCLGKLALPKNSLLRILNVTLPEHISNFYPDPPRRPEDLTLPFEGPAKRERAKPPPSINEHSLRIGIFP